MAQANVDYQFKYIVIGPACKLFNNKQNNKTTDKGGQLWESRVYLASSLINNSQSEQNPPLAWNLVSSLPLSRGRISKYKFGTRLVLLPLFYSQLLFPPSFTFNNTLKGGARELQINNALLL